jgi:mRNA interferase RelE/StbE
VSLGWRIEYEGRAQKQLKTLDRAAGTRIVPTLQDDLTRTGDPRATGKARMGDLTGLRRYRIGDYRAIARIKDQVFTVFIIEVAHGRDVYR